MLILKARWTSQHENQIKVVVQSSRLMLKNRLQMGEGHSQVTIGSKPVHSLFHKGVKMQTQCLSSVALAVCFVLPPQKADDSGLTG